MDEELKKLIEDKLKVPCELDATSISYPSATVDTFLEQPDLFGDGKCVSESCSVSISLWYRDRSARNEAVKELKKVLLEAGYTAPAVQKYFDNTARVYRADLTTEKINKEE